MCYIKEGGGLDNISVGWQLPNGTLERPMSAANFSLPADDPDPEPDAPIGEVGLAQVDHNWTTITLNNTYTSPVVVAGAATYNGSNQSTVRVRNITSNSFDLRVDEWDCLDEGHTIETIPYIVIEEGSHTLPNGKTLQAGKVQADHTWQDYTFPQVFNEIPVLLAQCASENDVATLNTRVNHNSTNTTGFRLLLQEADRSSHATEDVCWIAIEPGTQDGADAFEAAVALGNADEVIRTVSFAQSYTDPVFVGKISSYTGGDPIALRYLANTLTSNSVDVLGEEEPCSDAELNHNREHVSFLVFEGVGNIEALGSIVPANPTVAATSHWPMDNNANDVIGSNNGTTVNGAGFSTSAQEGSHALNLDGNNDYVSIPNSTSLNVNANFSLSVWINPTSTSGVRGILTKLTNTSHKQYALSIQDGQLRFDYELDANNWALGGGSIPTNTWSFIVVTVEQSGQISIYVNGSLVSRATAPALPNLDTQPFEIGRWGGSYNDFYFAGTIDDVKFFDKVLTEAEIGDLSNLTAAKAFGIQNASIPDELQMSLYPNPVSQNGEMNIALSAAQGEEIAVEIFNAQGLPVLKRKQITMNLEKEEVALTVKGLQPGVYIVVGSYSGGTVYKRFVVGK